MQNRNALKYLFLANIISGFAQGISMLAIPWYFKSVLNEESLFGLIYAGATLFTMVWSLYSGLLVDRYSRKSNFFFINLIGGAVLLGIATSGFVLGYVPMALIAAVFVTTMLVYNIHYPALYAFAQEISKPDDYGRVNSYIEIQGQSTSVISGAFAALLISGTTNGHLNLMGFNLSMPFDITPWKLQDIFMLNAATYFLALICISLIKYKPHAERVIDTGTIYERLKTGFTFLKHHKNISVFGQASFMVFVVLIVEVHFLLPSYINNHLKLSADVYASAEIYYAIGALFAGFAIRRLFVKTNEVKAVIILMVLAAAFFFMASLTNSLLLFFFISVMFGVTNAGIRVLRITWLFNHVPNNVIGRTNSIFNMSNIFLRATLTSIFALPFFAQGNNIVWAYGACAVFVVLWIVPLLMRYKKIVHNPKLAVSNNQ
jgi:DHA3 family macrolide efflux protein-like MFS transporter